MGKLSKFVLSTIAFTSVNGQDSPNFQVTSCNADVSKDMDKLKGYYKGVRVNESILFFANDVTSRWASNHGLLHGNYREK